MSTIPAGDPQLQPGIRTGVGAQIARVVAEHRGAETERRALVAAQSGRASAATQHRLAGATRRSAAALQYLRVHGAAELADRLQREADSAMALLMELTCEDTNDDRLAQAVATYSRCHVASTDAA